MGTRMLQRRGTAAEWAAANPVLGDGEVGFERDTGIIKVGDGLTSWSDLVTPYITRGVIDADGDLLVGSGPDAVTRLAKGAPGQRLTVDSGGNLVWETPTPPVPISVVDAIGDLIVGTGADSVGRLAAGLSGQRLYVKNDGTLGWDTDRGVQIATSAARPSSPYTGQVIFETDTNRLMVYIGGSWYEVNNEKTKPKAALRQAAAQSVPNAAWTSITFDTEDLDTHDGHSTTVNPSRYTVPVAGSYLVVGHAYFASNSSGDRALHIIVNNGGTTTAGGNEFIVAANGVASHGTGLVVTGLLPNLAVGDYIELQAYQNSGGALALTVSPNLTSAPQLAIVRV